MNSTFGGPHHIGLALEAVTRRDLDDFDAAVERTVMLLIVYTYQPMVCGLQALG